MVLRKKKRKRIILKGDKLGRKFVKGSTNLRSGFQRAATGLVTQSTPKQLINPNALQDLNERLRFKRMKRET